MYRVNLKTWFPYVGSFILCLGILDTYIYYYLFHLNIGEFVSTMEMLSMSIHNVISSFFDNFVYLYFCVLFVLVCLCLVYLKSKRDKKIYIVYFYVYRKCKNTCSNITILTFVLILVVLFYNCESIFKFYVLFVLSLISTTFAAVVLSNEFIYCRKIKIMQFNLILYGFIILIVSNIISVYSKYHFVKCKHAYANTRITTDKEIIISNDSIYYIGHTEKYLFLRNEIESSVVVIPMSRINELMVKIKQKTTLDIITEDD